MTIARKYQQKQFADISSAPNKQPGPKQIKQGKGVVVKGTKYFVEDVLVVGVSETYGQPEFGKITNINPVNADCSFRYRKFQVAFHHHFHAYEIDHLTDESANVKQSSLKYILPASQIGSISTGDFLCIRHAVM